MPKYIFTYRQAAGYVPGSEPDAMAAWESFFENIADSVVDPGHPVFERATIGDTAPGTQLGGYSVVTAASLEDAVALANLSPTVQRGGAVEIGLLAEVPGDHIVNRLRERVSPA